MRLVAQSKLMENVGIRLDYTGNKCEGGERGELPRRKTRSRITYRNGLLDLLDIDLSPTERRCDENPMTCLYHSVTVCFFFFSPPVCGEGRCKMGVYLHIIFDVFDARKSPMQDQGTRADIRILTNLLS